MVKVLLIILVIAILMDDSSSIRKTEEERKEDEDLAKAVNATLAEEEEKKRQEEKKKNEDKKKGKVDVKGKDQDEACPPLNSSCPTEDPCPEIQECSPCPEERICPEERTCPPCEDCPICFNQTCRPCHPCKPCQPCPVLNSTVEATPTVCQCPEGAGLSLPTAVAVGAVTGILVTGTAAAIGLILRYVSPIVSGFIFVATIVIIWYLCSHYPETAREIGGRAANLLREAAVALGHRVMEAIQRHQEQVGVPTKPKLFFRMSSMFYLKKFALRFSM
jgi:hypothetical protein